MTGEKCEKRCLDSKVQGISSRRYSWIMLNPSRRPKVLQVLHSGRSDLTDGQCLFFPQFEIALFWVAHLQVDGNDA